MPMENETNQPMSIRLVGLAATPNASNAALETVACFAAQTPIVEGNTPVAQWCVYTSDAVNGDTFRLIKRGIYSVDLCIPCRTADRIQAAISVDSLAADLAADPEPSTNATTRAAVRRWGEYTQAAAGDRLPITLSAKIYITQALVNAGILASNTGIVRALLSNGADGPPVAAAIDIANAIIEITREGDLPGS